MQVTKSTMRIEIEAEKWEYKVPFRVSRGAEEALDVIVVTLTDAAGNIGRGEAAGVDYDGEDVGTLCAQLEETRPSLEAGLEAAALAGLLPAGGARNAVDCALWDLHAKQSGQSIWQLTAMPCPRELMTAVTLGIDTLEATTAGAFLYREWPVIKVKVDGERHVQIVRRVHEICPAAALIVDPNQAWSCNLLNRLAPELASLGVILIEQPVARGEDESLRDYTGSVRLAADESVATRGDVIRIKDLYDVINVKLDKSGGLTEALAVAYEASARGLSVMVGCMAGTSLAMAPGMVVGQLAQFVDLDGPLLHSRDREDGIDYRLGRMGLPSRALWG